MVPLRQGRRRVAPPMRSNFQSLRVRPAGGRSRRPAQAAATDENCWDGVLLEVTLLVEWLEGAEAPTESNLADMLSLAELVRLAKIRWRIETDYRGLKHGLGLGHFEGRSWNGWHHHVTLVTAPHAILTEQWSQRPVQRTHPLLGSVFKDHRVVDHGGDTPP